MSQSDKGSHSESEATEAVSSLGNGHLEKNVIQGMSHSRERIMSFAPWVTHEIELRAFIVRKMPQSKDVALYRKRNMSFASKGYSCKLSSDWL